VDTGPTWMKTLAKSANQWLALLPEGITLMDRSPENIKDPLFRFFDREVGIGAGLIKLVREDLNTLLEVCNGTVKQTNYLRALMADLLKGKRSALAAIATARLLILAAIYL